MFRTILVPAEIQAEIDSSDLKTIEKTVIYWLVWRCGILRHRACPIHQRTLDVAIGQRHRMAVMRFIRKSAFIVPALQGLYRPLRQSIRYTIEGVEVVDYGKVETAQHKNELGTGTAWLGSVEYRKVDFDVLFVGVKKAWEAFGWNTARLVAEWGIAQMDEPDLTLQEVRELAKDKDGGQSKVETRIDKYQRFLEAPGADVFRKDGRVYSRLTSVAGGIRKGMIRFGGEKSTSVDVSCCYAWILAAEHRQWLVKSGGDTGQVDEVLALIRDRKFYDEISKRSGTDYEDVKKLFQIFCLFGEIGKHPVWFALRSLCPGICRTIEWWRSQPGGATHLAHYLQRAEGALMTDGVVNWLASQRVPVVQVHDGCYVPRDVVDSAVEYLKKRSVELFGTECFVKVA